jgi:hypothetical protein
MTDNDVKPAMPASDEAPTAINQETAARQPMTFSMTIAAMLLISIGVTLVGQLTYHKWFSKPAQRVVTVDLNEVLGLKQIQLMKQATRPGATDADRAAAYDAIGQFGKDIEATLNDMQHDCNCLLVVRAAVLGGQSEDLTNEVKKRLGLEQISLAQAVDSLANRDKQSDDIPARALGKGK